MAGYFQLIYPQRALFKTGQFGQYVVTPSLEHYHRVVNLGTSDPGSIFLNILILRIISFSDYSSMSDTLGKVALFLFCSLAACGSVAEETDVPAAEPANISVKVAGMQDGKVYLIGTYETLNLRLDSTEMKIGEARFSRDSLYPTGLYYLYYPNQSFNQILLDKDQTFSLVTQANDLVESMQVENSIDNELLYRGLRYDTKYQTAFDSLAALLKEAGSDQMKTEFTGQQKLLQQKRKEFLTELFEKYPESHVSKINY